MKYFFLLLVIASSFCIKAQQLYFPSLNNAAVWESTSPQSLGWCTNYIDTLYHFLETNNTKGFIVLKDGKIVLEKYFGTFTKDSNWYWASAAKSLTSLLIGQAQEDGFLSINDTTSTYLGNGWTNCTGAQEQKITILNQLTMTSGLDDGIADNHCTSPNCLLYKADAGSRWAYHNAPYTLLDSVLYKSTGQTLNVYTQLKVKQKTGINGAWYKVDFDNLFISTPRSFARYGLLAQHNFIWNTDTLIKDTVYKHAMVNSSQGLNLSYGYLWWLNGKASFMLPTSQFVIPGSYAPHAPADMFAGIGKNGQIVSIAKSKGLVMVRMGNPPGSSVEVPTDFCDKIWEQLNKVICSNSTSMMEPFHKNDVTLYPNPATSEVYITTSFNNIHTITITNMVGELIYTTSNIGAINLSSFAAGIYIVSVSSGSFSYTYKLIKQ